MSSLMIMMIKHVYLFCKLKVIKYECDLHAYGTFILSIKQ